jgi:hypothetical protein
MPGLIWLSIFISLLKDICLSRPRNGHRKPLCGSPGTVETELGELKANKPEPAICIFKLKARILPGRVKMSRQIQYGVLLKHAHHHYVEIAPGKFSHGDTDNAIILGGKSLTWFTRAWEGSQ